MYYLVSTVDMLYACKQDGWIAIFIEIRGYNEANFFIFNQNEISFKATISMEYTPLLNSPIKNDKM